MSLVEGIRTRGRLKFLYGERRIDMPAGGAIGCRNLVGAAEDLFSQAEVGKPGTEHWAAQFDRALVARDRRARCGNPVRNAHTPVSQGLGE